MSAWHPSLPHVLTQHILKSKSFLKPLGEGGGNAERQPFCFAVVLCCLGAEASFFLC